ncbi:hypothetical protein [Actinacidiphila acidipaludis]|uniref:Uncharacterized protein n=1 Tax=Actinacidiphila acidipaludis TaxID=2873382 RepID=A0ABS7Q7U0_9ACTN|nr:hypothetical protein [Streptomyces acidipaludis]MBY8879218.1 hypothetical protein [Streptomyces acidipaludis]
MSDTSGSQSPCPSANSELPPPCDLVTVPSRQGLEAVDILRLGTGLGPVLHDSTGASLGFLVPPGTADCWDVPGSSCTRTDGRGIVIDGPPPVRDTGWLVPPPAATSLTDPVVLRAALGEAARTIELADGLCPAVPEDPQPA